MNRRFWCGTVAVVALCAAVAASEQNDPKAAAKASLERFKKLAGTWVSVDDKGKPTDQVVSVYKVTAAGSAVHETVFPGSDHEMVSMFHLDGGDFLLTHYCAAGNQPRMKADPKSAPNRIDFKFAGGTNLDVAKDMHMHEGSITFVDADHIEWKWIGYEGGKPSADHQMTMKLSRKK